jgi:hypothetical protein
MPGTLDILFAISLRRNNNNKLSFFISIKCVQVLRFEYFAKEKLAKCRNKGTYFGVGVGGGYTSRTQASA